MRIIMGVGLMLGAAGCFKIDTPPYLEEPIDAEAPPDMMVVACTSGGEAHEDAGCPDEAPICDVDDTCRPCAAHDECDSGACYTDGVVDGQSCVPSSSIAYVDLTAPADNTECTQSDPCSTINAGNITNRPVILVAPGLYTENLVLSHAAPGQRTLLAANVSLRATSTSNTALTFEQGTGNEFRIVGLEVINSGIGILVAGAVEGDQVNVTLDHVTVADNAGEGVVVSPQCQLEIAHAFALRNAGGGIRVRSSGAIMVGTLQMENTVVKDNGNIDSELGGVLLEVFTSATIVHSTIVGNSCVDTCVATGIWCADCDPSTVTSSILVGNDTTGTHIEGNQILGSPSYSYSIVAPESVIPGDGVINEDPGFKPDGYHLAVPSSPAVEQGCHQGSGDPCGTDPVEDDIDGQPRDLVAPDIGADECMPDGTGTSCE